MGRLKRVFSSRVRLGVAAGHYIHAGVHPRHRAGRRLCGKRPGGSERHGRECALLLPCRGSRQATNPEDSWPIKYLAAALVSLSCGVGADAVLVLPFALYSEPWRMWFAAFGIGALFGALAAGWVATLIASDRTRSRLLLVVGISEVIAAVVAVGGFLVLRSAVPSSSALLAVLPALFLGLGMVIVVLAGSWAALRFRSPRKGLAPDIVATLGLLGLLIVIHIKTIILAPLP